MSKPSDYDIVMHLISNVLKWRDGYDFRVKGDPNHFRVWRVIGEDSSDWPVWKPLENASDVQIIADVRDQPTDGMTPRAICEAAYWATQKAITA